jgi:menaquinone-dependent protoporphyrinogen IX oxidase
MHIGIIVYSQTGNTLTVAQRMKETLEAAGHTAEIRPVTVEAVGNPNPTSPVTLKDAPGFAGLDAVIFGAPVQAFSLCRAMTQYLKQIPDIKTLPVACYVLQGLPKKWMGGNRAYRTLRKLCLAKGADPIRIGHVHWGAKERDKQIADTISGALKFAATVKPA